MKGDQSTGYDILREQALQRLRNKRDESLRKRGLSSTQLLEELEIQHVELEMQNSQLIDTQTALEAARGQLFDLYELAPIAYFVLDSNHRIRSANLRAAELLRSSRQAVLERPFDGFLDAASKMAFHRHVAKVFASGKTETQVLSLAVTREGHPVEIQMESALHRDSVPDERRVLVACIDVSAQRRSEEALREAERRLRVAIEASLDAFMILKKLRDPFGQLHDFIVMDASGPALTLFGIQRQELGMKTLRAAVARLSPPKWMDLCLASVMNAEPVEGVLCVEDADGKTRHFNHQIAPTSDGAAITVREVTREVEEREHANRLEKRLHDMQRFESLSLMASGVAHDFNNLLSSILGLAELGMDEIEDREAVSSSFDSIRQNVQRGAELCRLLVGYAGGQILEKKSIDLSAYLKEDENFLSCAAGRRAKVTVEPADNHCPVVVDPAQLQQILTNLLVNAVEARPQGCEIRISNGKVTVRRADLDHPDWIVPMSVGDCHFIEVSDNGPGIAPDVLQKIFDPFFSTKSGGRRGLGLASLVGIVRGHRGGLRVTTTEGEGTTFKLFFEASVDDGSRNRADSLVAVPDSQLQRGRVLLVDDEDFIRRVHKRLLESLGQEVVDFSSPVSAEEWLRADDGEITAALVDYTMPEVSGLELCRRFREIAPRVPLIMMSGYPKEDVSQGRLLDTFDAFLQKPISKKDLRMALSQVIRNGQSSAVTGR